MSEVERKRRQEYKRNRKRWILIQAIVLALVCVISLGSFVIRDQMDRTYYIEYTENGAVDYSVKYQDNAFFDEEWIGSHQSYVTSLVDAIKAEFSYALRMDSSNVGFDYTYGITAQLVVSDKDTGDHIFDPIEPLLPDVKASQRRSDSISIKESVAIDFPKYNALAHQFVEAYGLNNATSMLVVTLHVDVISQCNEFESNNQNSYFISLNIPLGEQNFSMHTTSNTPEDESKVLACRGIISQNIPLAIGIASAVIALLLACILVFFIYVTRNEDVNYTIKVKKILKSYRSFIQQIEGEFDTEGYQIVKVKTFTEMLGIRDTIQSPVLMSENADETRALFLVPTNTKILYLYEIKVDNYDQLYAPQEETVEEETEEEPCSSVLVVEDESGMEEAIILDESVDREEIAEAMATPDVVLEEVDFVGDDDVDYEGTEEEPGLEVVSVVWPEEKKGNKVYRYDPNGEVLEKGDMVLVPTHDAAKDREVIRKAAVAHANHTIDPDTHPHPLKKIIAVIKRHARMAITPKDDEGDR